MASGPHRRNRTTDHFGRTRIDTCVLYYVEFRDTGTAPVIAGGRPCRRSDRSRRHEKTCVPARRRPHRLARSYTRRWIRSAVVNTAPGPRNRRSPLAFRKRGARALTFRRRRKAKARKVRVKVRHTLIPWGQHKRNARRRPRVAWAVSRILKHEPQNTVSQKALSRHARRAAARRTASERSAAARAHQGRLRAL